MISATASWLFCNIGTKIPLHKQFPCPPGSITELFTKIKLRIFTKRACCEIPKPFFYDTFGGRQGCRPCIEHYAAPAIPAQGPLSGTPIPTLKPSDIRRHASPTTFILHCMIGSKKLRPAGWQAEAVS